MTLTVRPLRPEDAEASRRPGQEAFGLPTAAPTEPATLDSPGRTDFGAFDGGRLVARMAWRDYESWYGGRLVRTCGVAGVTVAAEDRGRGTLRPLFTETLEAARAAGALLSTLFPTAPRIYRRFGYELISDYATVAVPSWVLGTVTRPDTGGTRRAQLSDVDAIRTIYDTWAAEQNGPLSRRGVSFPTTAEEYLADFTGVTVAVDDAGKACGFASWDRGPGYGEEAVLQVSDLLALTADGYRWLLATAGSFASVTGTVKINTSGEDVVRLFLPSLHWKVVASDPYMLRVLNVTAAFAGRGYPPGVYGQLGFRLAGDFLEDLNGGYLLQVADGASVCTRSAVGATERTFTPAGLVLTYAGVQSSSNLRFAGHLSGGDPAQDPLWDALFGGRSVHIRDYF